MDVTFTIGAYDRDWGNLPALRMENMFAEEAKSTKLGVAIQSRRGISPDRTVGTGPINGLYAQNGVFNGDLFSLSGAEFYRETSLLGTVTGSGPGSIASSPLELTVTAGGTARFYDGATLADVAFPETFNVVSTEFMAGFHLHARENTGRIYFGDALDASSAMNFFSAEFAPDGIFDIIRLKDILYAFGNETVQLFIATGDPTLPFQSIDGVVINKGAFASGCAVLMDNTLFWIGHDGICYTLGFQRVSTHGVEEDLRETTTARAFTYLYEGHTFFGVRTDNATWLMDVVTGEWTKYLTDGHVTWDVSTAATPRTTPFFGSATNGDILVFDEFDDDGADLTRVCSGAMTLDDPMVIHSLQLEVNSGFTPFASGANSNPDVEMRFSTDGHSFSDWITASMGVADSFSARPLWQGLGQFDTPGAIFEFRVTQPVPFRISAVRINNRLVAGPRGDT